LYWNEAEDLMRCTAASCELTATRVAACGRSPDLEVYAMSSTFGFTAPFFVAVDADGYIYCPRSAAFELPHNVMRFAKSAAGS
jgi:hypothetical protein